MAQQKSTAALVRVMKGFKSRLTQAENRGDWPAVIATAQQVDTFFARYRSALPDTWAARFERARADAEAALRRLEAGV